AALGTRTHKGRHKIVDDGGSRNPCVAGRCVVGFYRRSRETGQEKVLAVVSRRMEIRVLVIPGIQLVLTPKHFVEAGNVLIEVLKRWHSVGKAAVCGHLVDREKLRQG